MVISFVDLQKALGQHEVYEAILQEEEPDPLSGRFRERV
jgi:hypothetical protein